MLATRGSGGGYQVHADGGLAGGADQEERKGTSRSDIELQGEGSDGVMDMGDVQVYRGPHGRCILDGDMGLYIRERRGEVLSRL